MSINRNYLPDNQYVFKANEYITLKLENNQTFIYVKGKRFLQCIRLVLNIDNKSMQVYDEIGSIDEAAEVYNHTLSQNRILTGPGAEPAHIQDHIITPVEEFHGHCSNIQTWVENNYDTRILYRNIAFPLLKELMFVGDPKAKKSFKEEIAERLESAYPNVVDFLIAERYLSNFNKEEIMFIIESPQFIKNLIKNSENYRNLNFLDSILRYVAPHYFEHKISTINKRQLHDIAPEIIESYGNLLFRLLERGKLKHLGKSIMNCQCIGISVNYIMLNKEYKKVRDMCKAILEIFPDSPEVWNSLAYSLTFTGDYNKALHACKQSLNYTKDIRTSYGVNKNNGVIPNRAITWNNMGWIYNYMGEYTKSIEVCKKSIELTPDFANGYNHLGFAYYKIGRTAKGIELIKKSLSLNPNYSRALSNLGLVYYELKDYEKSFKACYRCMKLDVRFKEAQSIFRKLIHNPDLKDLSLKYHNLDIEFSDMFLKFLRWLRKKSNIKM